MAKVYADMYTESRRRGLEAVGGPSFTKVAVGVRSVRYFVSRVSMWVANTALAAYSKIVFLIFDFDYFPNILNGLGVTGGCRGRHPLRDSDLADRLDGPRLPL